MQTNMEKFKYHIKEANLNNFRNFSKKSKKTKFSQNFYWEGFPDAFIKENQRSFSMTKQTN